MTPEQFVAGLQREAQKRGLTASDLAIWFGRPRPTVRTWLCGISVPLPGIILDEYARRLKLLRASRAFPVPYEITKFQRKLYIRRAFQDADNARISGGHPTARGAQMRRGDR